MHLQKKYILYYRDYHIGQRTLFHIWESDFMVHKVDRQFSGSYDKRYKVMLFPELSPEFTSYLPWLDILEGGKCIYPWDVSFDIWKHLMPCS